MDKKVISCAFNIDTACVEIKYADGSMIAIDCTLVEAEVARNMYKSSELEWLVTDRTKGQHDTATFDMDVLSSETRQRKETLNEKCSVFRIQRILSILGSMSIVWVETETKNF